MFDADTLNACLAELPPFDNLLTRSFKRVNEPARPSWQEPDTYIYMDGDPRQATIGYVYTIPNERKQLKQVYVEVTEDSRLLCGEAYYLENPHPDLKSMQFANSQPYGKIRSSGQGRLLNPTEQAALVRVSGWPEVDTTIAARLG